MIAGPRIAGLLAGLMLVAGGVLAARPAAGPPLGLDLRLAATPSGEVGVEPPGPVLRARALRPGGLATGEVVLRNHTAFAQDVRPVLDGARGADRHVRVSLTAHGTHLFDGRLSELRAGSRAPLRLAVRQRATIAVRAWVPAGADDAAIRGRAADLGLSFVAERAR